MRENEKDYLLKRWEERYNDGTYSKEKDKELWEYISSEEIMKLIRFKCRFYDNIYKNIDNNKEDFIQNVILELFKKMRQDNYNTDYINNKIYCSCLQVRKQIEYKDMETFIPVEDETLHYMIDFHNEEETGAFIIYDFDMVSKLIEDLESLMISDNVNLLDTREAVKKALMRLNDRDREYIIDRYVKGIAVKDIVVKYGISKKAHYVLIKKIIQKITDMMNGEA